jgi:hypothetical protein
MRVAPPVQALSCGAGRWQLTQQLFYALTAFVFAYWGGSHLFDAGLAVWLGSLAFALVTTVCAARWLRQPVRQLIWDAEAWRVAAPRGDAQCGQVALMLDFGGWMLVRFIPAGSIGGRRSQWLPLSRDDAGVQWPALRVALHSLPTEPAAARRALPAA